MKISVQRLEPRCRVQCTVEVDAVAVQEARMQALQYLGRGVTVPGFRPGHAPSEMILLRLGEEKIFEEAIRVLMPNVLRRILEGEKLQPVLPPRVQVDQREPLRLVVLVVEGPEVRLAGVDAIRIPKRQPVVEQKDVDRVVTSLLHDLGEKELTSTVVRRITGRDQSIEDFHTELRNMLLRRKEQGEQDRRERECIAALAHCLQSEIPEELLEAEVEDLLRAMASQLEESGLSLEQWLGRTERSKEEFFATVRRDAGQRLKSRLAIQCLARQRSIQIGDEQVRRVFRGDGRSTSAMQPGKQTFEQVRFRLLVDEVLSPLLEKT